VAQVMIHGQFKPDDGWARELQGHTLPPCPDCGDRLVEGSGMTRHDFWAYGGIDDPSLDAGEKSVRCRCGADFTIVRGVLGASNWCRRRRTDD
jgi:hypothetical protein